MRKDKILTEQDVLKLNEQKDATIVWRNTRGQDPDIVSKLNKNVKIQILGGYDDKEYKGTKYINRTLYTPEQVSAIINIYKQMEKNIQPKWSTLEKSFYVYTCIVLYMTYDTQSFIRSEWEKDKIVEPFKNDEACINFRNKLYHEYLKQDDVPPMYRNLCTLVMRKGHCAGFANCVKEGLDRLGIGNRLVHVPNLHTFNVIKIGKDLIIADPSFEHYTFDVENEIFSLPSEFARYESFYDYFKNFSNFLEYNKVSKEKDFKKLSRKALIDLYEAVMPYAVRSFAIEPQTIIEEKPIKITDSGPILDM